MSSPLKQVSGLLLLCTSLSSCGMFDKIDRALPDNRDQYKDSKTIPPLEYPPTITDPNINGEMPIPEVSANARAVNNSQNTVTQLQTGTNTTGTMPAPRDKPPVVDLTQTARQTKVVVLPELNEVEVKKEGNNQWMLIHAEPEQIWSVARQFWIKNGFELEIDAPALGVLQTKWVEDSSTSTRNRYRMRLERGSDSKTTELYISHQGTKRVRVGDDYVWQPLIWLSEPANKELENEMMKRMLVYFGLQDSLAMNFVAQANTASNTDNKIELQKQADGLSLLVRADFESTWRDTGIALDRIGFSVDKRDRTNRVYVIRYANAKQAAQSKGLWDTLFGSSDQIATEEYIIFLMPEKDENHTRIAVLSKKGNLESTQTAEQILTLLRDQLR
ncbi:putative lipoprotein [Beggiatoa alba B18LD]|uniref:Putative lipoprotein n=1 Tax=Beggiatoa alba B18LD TaxID=395493 RepID=I3CKQ4_9GAMM|nr:outer membrane protein assembly factor BamC [Beggiatoa alba]EIJ44197.1 putative lipoprotein [Beggiatoa alba B18LD]